MPYLQTNFPALEAPLRALVEEHTQIEGEPLFLAVAYDAGRDGGHVFLFELIGNFGSNMVDPDRRFFETTFAGARVFPKDGLRPDLRVVLTSPSELTVAIQDHWTAVAELRRAIGAGTFDLLHEAGEEGHTAWKQLSTPEAVQ